MLDPHPATETGARASGPWCVVIGIIRVKLSPTPTFHDRRGQSGIAPNVTTLGLNQGFTERDLTYAPSNEKSGNKCDNFIEIG